MADYVPPTQNLPIFDTTVFTSAQNEYLTYSKATGLFLTFPTAQGAETLQGITVNGASDFTGDVNFNSMVSPPHCTILPSSANDLCNKQYVDSQAPLTSYQLFLNYSETFTTPAPASVIYKKLNSLEILVPTPVPWTISTIGNQLIAGFFNSLVGLNIPTSIPAGLWTILCYSNVNLIADQSHIGIFFTISGYDSVGVETILFTSVSSPLITVVSPLIGTSSVSLTVPLTSLVGYTGIGIKLYISSNVNATRTGTIFFQNQSSYSSILTSFRTQQAPDLLSLNNIWTGTNAFNNATSGALSSIADASINGVKIGTGGGAVSNINIGLLNLTNGALSTGTNNYAIGQDCLKVITSGQQNIGIGRTNLQNVSTGSDNVTIGVYSGTALTTETKNTYIGSLSGNIDTGSANTCIGYLSNCSTYSNSSAIGQNATATAGQQIMLGCIGLYAPAVVMNSSCSIAGAVSGNSTLSITGNTTLGANITSTGSTAKFLANFDSAISANTLKFQNSTVNGQTYMNAIPNGNATQSGMRYYNTFDVLNAGALTISSTSTENVLNTTNLGTGVLVPLNIKMGGTTALSVSTAGAITASGATQINNTLRIVATGLGATPSLIIQDTAVGNQQSFLINATAGAYNGTTVAGDTVIFARQLTVGLENTAVLNLTTSNGGVGGFSSGLRIAQTDVRLGMGSGVTTIPSANILIQNNNTMTLSTSSLPAMSIDASQIVNFNSSPTAPTPITSDNSTKVATTAFIKTIAAPANFAGLGNSFFNSFLYSNANPNLDYMIAGTLGGLVPVTNAAILIPSLTTFILMGVRLQAGILFNRYGWNQQTGTSNLRCALYTSNFVYVTNSVSSNSASPGFAGGRVEVTTSATVTIPVTDTYYIYVDSSNATTTPNVMYGAFGLGVNVCNYIDANVFTFTAGLPLPNGTVPFKVATGVRPSGSAPTINTDLKIGGLSAMTYQQYLFGVFLSYTA